MNNAYTKVKEALELWGEGQKNFKKGNEILSSGGGSYYFDKVEGYIEALFDRFAPFKEGDRIRIKKKPNCDNGWKSSEHFLVLGAEGVVRDVDYRDDSFNATVIFDNESWVSSQTGHVTLIDRDKRHLYTMWESQIERVSSQCGYCGK